LFLKKEKKNGSETTANNEWKAFNQDRICVSSNSSKRSDGGLPDFSLTLYSLLYSTSFVRAARQVVRGFMTIFDRTNPTVKSLQDVGINLSIFVGAIVAMHKYGQKLSV
jgi:hypothetical protein